MNCPYVFKKCTKCDVWLVACNINFSKTKRGKYGLRSYCKKCQKKYREEHREEMIEYQKKYRKENKKKVSEYRKKYIEEHREELKQYYEERKEEYKRYYEENRGKILERKRKYREEHKEEILEYSKKYRQTPQGQVTHFNSNMKRRQTLQSQGKGMTVEQWVEMMEFFNWKCAYSNIPLNKNNRSIDHIKCLDNGGLNEIWNCVPMYKSYNSSKNTKDMLEWYQQQDFYSEERLQKIYEWQEYAYNKWNVNI